MSRPVVGASPYFPVTTCCFVIVLLHRLVGWLIANSKPFGRLIEGEKILLFEDGIFLKENMKKALICQEDLLQGLRKSALIEEMDKIEKVYMERNGKIRAIRKK